MREVLGHFLKLKSSGEGVPDASSQSRRDAPRRRSVADRAGALACVCRCPFTRNSLWRIIIHCQYVTVTKLVRLTAQQVGSGV
jgi:hypothetical protein